MPKKEKQSQNIRFAALAVDVVCFRVFEGRLQVLLGKVNSDENPFNGMWAHIGGLVKADEIAEQSVERLLEDKAGIKDIYKEQLYTFSELERDPRGRVVSVAYIALTADSTVQNLRTARVETKWANADSVQKLGYDHDKILSVAIDRLRAKVTYTDIAKYLVNKKFTLTELQAVYEAILGESLDKRNFRKRILSLGVLREYKKKIKIGVMRPAAVYSFK